MSDSVEKCSVTERKRAAIKRWREANREHVKAYQKAWTQRNREHVAGYQKEYMAEYSQKETSQYETWTRNLRRNYQMTPEDFNALWDAQEGKCAICGNAMKPRGRTKDAVGVDHNHATGKVRGLLCRGCNHGIGNLQDDPRILKAAAQYLIDRGSYAHIRKALK